MKIIKLGLALLISIAFSRDLGLAGGPQANPEPSLVHTIADSSWDGAMGDVAKGNSPAQLRIVLQKDKLTGFLTYAGFEETLAVTVSAPSSIRMKGVSVRDLQGARRSFDLDTLNAELSQGGRRLSGTTGTRARFEFRRLR